MLEGARVEGRSLSVRLGIRLAVLMIVAICLTAAAVAWRAVESARDLDDFALQKQAQFLASQLPDSSQATESPKVPDSIVSAFRSSDADSLFLVLAGDKVMASSDPVRAEAVMRSLHHPSRLGFFRLHMKTPDGRSMVGLAVPSGIWHVVVLQGGEQASVLLQSFLGDFMIGAVLLVLPIGLAAIAVAVVTVRRGLRPLEELSAKAAFIGPSKIAARLPVAGLPAEISPLVEAMNKVLDRLEQTLWMERRFIGDAAHGMRTPLAVITARLDTMTDLSELPALRQDVGRLTRLVGQLLRITRIESGRPDLTQSVDLRQVVVEAASALVPLALKADVEIALDDAPDVSPIPGNHDLLVVAVTNLIENALNHAPPGSAVEIELRHPATISVKDAGPGVPAEDMSRIFERFGRGTHSKSGGAGLGLAIVAEVAAAHAGDVSVENGNDGGAVFRLRLGNHQPAKRSEVVMPP